MRVKEKLTERRVGLIIFFLAILFSTLLMVGSFSYSGNEMQIGIKAWSDFASHIPLIRSFSLGLNFPPEYPLFPGEPIKYHFLFYAFVGLLERLGLRIDFALNIPSIIGFSALVFMIYKFSQLLFNSLAVSILSVILFLFNGSLSFIFYFKKNPPSLDFFQKILSNQDFPSFGPYDSNIVSAFWNLNIYTNQRHFGLSLAVSLLIIYLLLKPILEKKKQKNTISIALGALLGLSYLLNVAVFFMSVLVLVVVLILFNKSAKNILISLVVSFFISFPLYLYFQTGGSSSISFAPGYLIKDNLSLINFLNYWFFNLGFHLLLIPIGFILAEKNLRKIILCFFMLFVIANLMQFSSEIAANHKFFNYFMIGGVIISSYVLVTMWRKAWSLRALSIVFFFLLVLSGFIDLFPILNDRKISIVDIPKNKEAEWILKNTPSKSIFLNSEYLYTPSTIAGRKDFLGWPYFAWSQGYDTNTRDNVRKALLRSSDLGEFCSDVLRYNINYVELKLPSQEAINTDFFNTELDKVYESGDKTYILYSTKRCRS